MSNNLLKMLVMQAAIAANTAEGLRVYDNKPSYPPTIATDKTQANTAPHIQNQRSRDKGKKQKKTQSKGLTT